MLILALEDIDVSRRGVQLSWYFGSEVGVLSQWKRWSGLWSHRLKTGSGGVG